MIQKDSHEIFRLTAKDTMLLKDEHGKEFKKNFDGIVIRVDAAEMPDLIKKSLKLRLNSLHRARKDPVGFDRWKSDLVKKGEVNFRDVVKVVTSSANATLKQQNQELLEAAKRTLIQMANLLASSGSDLETAIEMIGKTCPLPGDIIVSLCTSTFEEFFKANPKKAKK